MLILCIQVMMKRLFIVVHVHILFFGNALSRIKFGHPRRGRNFWVLGEYRTRTLLAIPAIQKCFWTVWILERERGERVIG